KFQCEGRVVRSLVLGLAQQDVAAYTAFQPCFEPAVAVQQHEAFALIGQFVHEGGRYHDVAEDDHAAQVVQRHLQLLLLLHVDAHGGVLQVRVSAGHHHVKGVLQLVHGGHELKSWSRSAAWVCRSASACGWQMSLSEHWPQRSSLTGGGSCPFWMQARTAAVVSSTSLRKPAS